MAPYTLYYTPGVCSLSPHIALREAKLPFELVKVDLRTKTPEWLAINPKGYVPAVRLPDGELLTEGAVMVQYIADQVPEAKLAPAYGTRARYRLNEWLHFIATELHKGSTPLYNALANEDYKTQLKGRLGARWAILETALQARDYLMGDFTVADGYAFWTLRQWQHAHKQSLDAWPALVRYYARLAARPAIQAALEAEGLQP